MAMGFNGCCYPGFNSNYVDMAPDFSGILMGIGNSIGNTPGFIAPYAAANFYSNGVNYLTHISMNLKFILKIISKL
jgi:hypothetical protein